MNVGHNGYLALLDEMKALHLKKAQDYGSFDDPLNNLRASAEIGIEPWRATWLRAKDKVKRIDAFCLKGSLANEGVEDSLMDLAAYALLCLALRREEQIKEEDKPVPKRMGGVRRSLPVVDKFSLCDGE